MEITGILKVKFKEQQVSDKFKKREFVLTDNSSQYPQHISFQLTQDKCSLIENFHEGEQMKVQFNLRGREWTSPQGETKYFNTLEAWRLERIGATSSAPKQEYAQPETFSTFNAEPSKDDLPF